MKIVCFGDSLTFGSIGCSYIKFLEKKSEVKIVNKGVNGDTTTHMCLRLKKYLGETKGESNTYIVSIGTNDIFLPYLTGLSPLWKFQKTPVINKLKCIENKEDFEKKYKEIIDLVLSNNHKLIVVGLPYLEVENYSKDKIDEKNAVIQKLAKAANIPYIDVNAIQKELKYAQASAFSWKYANLARVFEGTIFLIMPFLKDIVSGMRHLNYTVDGIHWNSAYAKAVAEKIEKEL